MVADPVDDYIRELVLQPEKWAYLDEMLAKRSKVDASVVAELRGEAAAAARKLQDLELKYAVGDISRATYGTARELLAQRRDTAQDKLDSLLGSQKIQLPSTPEAARKLWKDKGVDWQRALVQTFITKVVIKSVPVMGRNTFDFDRVQVEWRF